MIEIDHFEDHGEGRYLVKFADGTGYGLNIRSSMPSELHAKLKALIESGAARIIPRQRELSEIVAYLEGLVDSIATAKMKIAFPSIDAVQKAKLEEARDVMDVVLSEGEAAISALSPEDRQLRYPMLFASGLDVAATARLVQAKALEQRHELSKIETWRLEAKRNIRLAPSADLAELAFKAMTQ